MASTAAPGYSSRWSAATRGLWTATSRAVWGRTTEGATISSLNLQYNGDTTSAYEFNILQANNNFATAQAVPPGTAAGLALVAGGSAAANQMGVVTVDIPG